MITIATTVEIAFLRFKAMFLFLDGLCDVWALSLAPQGLSIFQAFFEGHGKR
jgi:hypothetical protein